MRTRGPGASLGHPRAGPCDRGGREGFSICCKEYSLLGPPARCLFTDFFFGEGSPTKVDYIKRVPLLLL